MKNENENNSELNSENKLKLNRNEIDPSTFSNYNDFVLLEYTSIAIQIDFSKRIINSDIFYSFKKQSNSNELVLDCNNVIIKSVLLKRKNKELEEKISYHISDLIDTKELGNPLVINIPNDIVNGNEFGIKILCETSESCSGLLWLNENQTTSNCPFVFSQCEPILCRSIIPCQDTPSVKTTYKNVNITIKDNSNLTCLFAGKKIDENNFYMDIPIPSYLFAFAAGKIEYREISERVGVYSEPSLIDKAAKEFEDTDNFINEIEKYTDIEYIWGKYNILILPPSFPYGGMENPCLTFLHPSIISGDKSLICTVAHEVAHSWTGNLVSNCNWNNFWMNEGFTVFLERKALSSIYGKELYKLKAEEGQNELTFMIKNLGENNLYTSLYPGLDKENPDDAFSNVPYERGFNFLTYLESLVGEDVFKDIIRIYLKKYSYKSVDWKMFYDIFITKIENNSKEEIENVFNQWIFKPGFLPVVINYQNEISKMCLDYSESLISLESEIKDDYKDKMKSQYKSWDSNTKKMFLITILKKISNLNFDKYTALKYIVDNYNYENCEIQFTWLQIALKFKDDSIIENVKKFLKHVGRMKFVRPVYKEFYSFNKEDCINFYKENKEIYHSVARAMLEKIFV